METSHTDTDSKFDQRQSDHVRQSLLGCRSFYAVVYALFYLACILYRNKLTSSWLYALCWYAPIAILSGYLFLTCANNPGYLNEHPPPLDSNTRSSRSGNGDGGVEEPDVEMQAVVRKPVQMYD